MLNENIQISIKNGNSLSKLESSCAQNSTRPCSCSHGFQTFDSMSMELNSRSLQNDTMLTHSVSESSNTPRNAEISHNLSSYNHSVPQTFNLPTNSVQELRISAVSHSAFPTQIPAVIPTGVSSSSIPLSPLLFHPRGPYILPNPTSANLSSTHLQPVNHQLPNLPLNTEYKNISPSGVLEATTHNQLPLATGTLDGSVTNSTKTSPSSQSIGANKGTNENGNYYVMVHVDAGETFSVRVGDQIQHIPGPATVRMVSNSGPPLPMPMQVPPGHLVQQIVDEEGILTHVILSPYPTPPLSMVATGGVPMSINQTNDVSTAGANLILNPSQHLQPHHPHPHLHPLLPSPGIPTNENLIHMNPYTLPHPQAIPGHPIHPFPPPPPQFIHPHLPHFHQQFNLHSPQAHVCAAACGGGGIGEGDFSTKYPVPSDVVNDTNHCDNMSTGSATYSTNDISELPSNNPSKQSVVKVSPDSTTTTASSTISTTSTTNNCNDGDNNNSNNNSSDITDTHSDTVTVNKLHRLVDGYCDLAKNDVDKVSFPSNNKKSVSPESSLITNSSLSNDDTKTLKSSKCSSNQTNGYKNTNDVCHKQLYTLPKKKPIKCNNGSSIADHTMSSEEDNIHIVTTHNSDNDDGDNDNDDDVDDDGDNHDDDDEDDEDDDAAITSTCGYCDDNDSINCEQVGPYCTTTTSTTTSASMIVADSSSSLTDVKHLNTKNHLSMENSPVLNGSMTNSDPLKSTPSSTAAATTTTAINTTVTTTISTNNSTSDRTKTTVPANANTTATIHTVSPTTTTVTTVTTSTGDNGRTTSGLNAFSSYSSSYPPTTFPSYRRRRGGGGGGAGVMGMNSTSGSTNNKNYPNFRSYNRPVNFGNNKSLQNSVWNQSSFISSKSNSDYYHQQHPDSLQNGSINNNNNNSNNNNNHTNHYQQHYPSPSYHQSYPNQHSQHTYHHRGSVITGGVGTTTAQELDLDSEAEIEKSGIAHLSTCSHLPVNILLPTVQSPSAYFPQSDCILNSQCYDHHHHHEHDHHHHAHPHPHHLHQQSTESFDAYVNGDTVGANGSITLDNDAVVISTTTNTANHNNNNNGGDDDFSSTATNNAWSTQDKIIHNLLSNLLSPQVTEVKSHSALIQLSFPQDLIHSSIEKTEIETTTSVSSSSSTTTTIATTNSEISSSTTTAASILPTDSSLSSQSRTFLTENNTYTNTTKSCKTTNSPVKSPRHKYKPSALSSATPKMTTTKVNSSKSDLNNGISNNNNNDNNTDECYNGNHESKANSNTVISNTNGMDSSQHQITIDLDAIQFELHLTERCSTPQFKCVFIGEATFISLQDLRPGTNYYVKVCCNYAGIRGDFSPIAHFVTLPSKPNPPRTIQVICQTRNSLHIKWGPGIDNGSRITSYKLEYAQVSTNSSEMGMDKNTDPEFFEPIQVFGRSYKINQLSPSTEYLIRVAAINQYGQSSWSPILSASTSGSPPDMPSPPFLIQADVHSLTLGWRPPSNLTDQYHQYHSHHYHHHLHHHHHHHHHHHLHDNICEQTNSSSYSNHLNPITYTLEMDDQAMGHGFVTVFDGTGTEHCVDNLRRNTRYRFRLAASNIDGRSRWSETVTLATLPDHPSAPRNLRIYGSLLQPTRLALTWDPPEDDGGTPIQSYRLEALLPYSSNNNNANLINGTPLASINNESGQKLNDVNNSNVNYSLEKIDDHLDVIQKLTCWPHVTVLKPDSSILSSINSSCSPNMITTGTDETYIVNSCDNIKTYTIVNEDKKSYSRVSETDSSVIDCFKVPENNCMHNNKTNKTAVITTTSTTVSTNISTSTMFNTDYDGESNYPQTAWFIIYEGREKELLLENLLPGFFLQLRVRACCSLLTNKINPSCSAFSSSPASSASSSASSSSSSSVSSGAASVSNLHNYPNDISFGVNSTAVTAVTTSTNVNSNVGIGSNGRNSELWGLASHPPLKIRMPPIPPSAPSSGPRVIGKPKPTSLHLSWSPPKQTGGAAILAYEVWQLMLEPTSWVDEESEDNDSNISIPRYCSSTPSSSLETSLLPLSCHNLQYYSTYNKYTSHCHSSHRQSILHRSYTDSSLNTKSYTLNNDNPVKLQSLFNDETTAVGVHGRFVCSVRENECRLFGLIPGQNYAFRVRAYNRAGKGLWTEWVSISTPPSLPGVPTSPPRLLPKSSRTIHIAWDPVTCINGAKIYEYRLECRQYQLSKLHDYYNVTYMPSIAAEKKGILNPSSSSSSHDNSSRNDTMEQADDDSFFQLIYAGSKLSFELTDLQPATLFAFRFCAVNSAGAGPWSSIAKCWTPSAPPDQPHGLCVREINYNSALIIWCIPQCNGSPITSFTIELTRFGHNITTVGGSNNSNKAGSGSRIHTDVNYIQIPAPYLLDYDGKQMNSSSKQQQQQHHTNLSTTENSNNNIQFQKNVIQHCLCKLKPSTNYMLRIQAVNKFGPSEYSVQTEFTTLAPLPQPPVFSQYKNLTSNSVRLEWNLLANHMNSDDGDDDYNNAGDDSNVENASHNNSSNAENHENEQNDNDGSGDGGEEDEVVNSHEEVHMNNSNSNQLRHSSSNNNNSKQQQNRLLKKQKANFKSLESQITFTLEISREPDLEWTTIYEGQASVHKVNRLCESTVYHFRVRATNTTGSGPYSTIQTIHTQKSSPPAVRGLKISELSSDRCQLEWTPVNQLGMDPIVYLLHLLPVSPNTQQSTNLSQVYRGNLPACRITGLNPASEYVCRVCAVRLCQPNKLPVISNSSYSSSEQEQFKMNSSTDSSQYQIIELPGPFSPGLVFTTPRLNKDGHSDSMSTNCHSFKQNSPSKQSTFLRILSIPFQTVRCILSFGRSSNRINDSSNSITPSKHHQTHSNQVTPATGTSSNSTVINASDKRRSVLVSTTTSSSTVTSAAAASMSSVSSSLTSSVSTISTPRNQSKQSSSSSSSSKRSHSWFRFTDTQLACLLLILFSLATLLVAISLQYLLNVHLKISNPTATVSNMDYSSYEVKLRSNNEDTSDSTLFTSTTTT